MDVAPVLQHPELAFTDRHPGRRRRLPPDFTEGSRGISEFHPRTEPVSSGTVSMGRVPPGDRRIRESAESCRGDQISPTSTFHFFSQRHHFILQGTASIGCGGRIYHLGAECVVRSFCHHRLCDRRTPSAGIHFSDRRCLVYGRLGTNSSRNSGGISCGRLRRG
jgi:hypothetical protein